MARSLTPSNEPGATFPTSSPGPFAAPANLADEHTLIAIHRVASVSHYALVMAKKLQMVGGGRMGQALIGGLLDGGWAVPEELAIVEVVAEQRAALQTQLPGVTISETILDSVDAVLAVKPYQITDVCSQINNPGRVLSIAAGVTIQTMEAALAPETVVVRAMPNTPALVSAGAAGVAGGTKASESDIQWAVDILSVVGLAVVVPEHLLDAVTGLSGSGPAYLFLMAEAMTDAGVSVGLTRDTAAKLAKQTIFGAGKMMAETNQEPVELRAGVTTPAGTTAAGLDALERHKFRSAITNAITAASERATELGRAESSK